MEIGNGGLNPAQAEELLKAMVGRKVAVIGDAMLDIYAYGRVNRISVEAPVPVFEVEREESMLGGAANTAKTLAALGARVRLCGLVGEDAEGILFLSEARAMGLDIQGILVDPSRPTIRKTRLIAQNQQMIRLDRESLAAPDPPLERRLASQAGEAAREAEAVVLSDYAKGLLTSPICRAAIRAAGKRPVIVDPKGAAWERYHGATILKPNRREASRFTGLEGRDEQAIRKMAAAILAQIKARYIVITRGGEGLSLTGRGPKGAVPTTKGVGGKARRKALHPEAKGALSLFQHFPAHPRQVYDPTGCGDTVAAVLGLAMASGARVEEAAWLANLAAGVKAGKFGTAAVNGQELLAALAPGRLPSQLKVMDRTQAAHWAARARQEGKRVVFTNGCFDILHFGHVSYLERSRRLGDLLAVGLNTDASVRRLKGPGRPIQPQEDRARILAAQACVDAVILFDEETPHDLIQALRPAILCKGADYRRKEEVVGWDLVESWGGRVVLVSLEEGRSSSNLIRKAKGNEVFT